MSAPETKIHVRLTPKAAQNAIQGWATDVDGKNILKISVTAVPDKGKANKALIALLADRLGIPKSRINLSKGQTDRNKTLIINGLSSDHLNSLLSSQ